MKLPLIFLTGLSFFWIEISGQLTSYKDPEFTEYFRMTGPGWIASDATISVPLPDGKVMWLMGDTNIDDYRASDTSMPCMFHLRNSILVQDATDRSKFITIIDSTKTGVNRTPVKLKDDDTSLFWPGHGFVKGDTAYVFYTRYHATTLARLGTFLAKIYWPELTNAAAIKSLVEIKNLNDTEFGNSVLIDTVSNYVYLYGQKPFWIVNDLYVARCSLDNILGPWEFYDGTGWTGNILEAEKILPVGYTSPSFSVIKIKQQNKYYLITQDIGFLACGYGRKIYSYSSETPYGPFTGKQTICLISDKYDGSYLVTYNTTAHQEFTKNNEILISYNVNNTCPSQCVNAFTDRYNADLYRPKFVRVPFNVLETGIVFIPEPYFTSASSLATPLKVTFDPELSVAPRDITSYAWDFGDGATHSNTDPFNKKITHTYAGGGIYNVKLTITDADGHVGDTTLTINLSVSSTDNPEMGTDEIYPNPTSGRLTVSLAGFQPGRPTIIVIENMMGQVVSKIAVREKVTNVELNGCSGLYYLHVLSGNHRNVYKITLFKKP